MKKFILLAFVAMMVTACGQPLKPDATAGDNTAQNGSAQNGTEENATTTGSVDNSDMTGTTMLADGKHISYEKGAINDPDNVLSERRIYFDYDSDAVPEKYLDLIKYHGKYLSLNPQARVRLEGNTDERGTREYNVALGERRAQAVKQLLLYEGVSPEQIEVISYGEEKPIAFGHDEESWQLNRRVDIVYK